MEATFKHSGDLGDIVYSLPVMKALGGGVLYLDPNGGKGTGNVNLGYKDYTNLNVKGIEFLRPLLEIQSYITDIKLWSGEAVDYNLDEFRKHIKFNNLAYSHLCAFKLPNSYADLRWLYEIKIKEGYEDKFILSRSPKVQGNHEFWEFNVRQIRENCVFIGLEKEHEIFEYALGYSVQFYKVSDALEMAEIIYSGKQFIGNQSLAQSIAEGLKKPLICEVNKNYPAVVFNRKEAKYV